MPRLQRAASSAGTLLAGTVLGLALLEGGARLVGLPRPGANQPAACDRAFWRFDATKGWAHVPGARARCDYGGPDAGEVRINSLGLRAPEPVFDPARPLRIAVVGDSFVFGIGVDEPHTLAAQLERHLAAAGHPAQAFNLGVCGYATDQELLLLRELGPRLRPAVVLLVMCDNDFLANTRDLESERYYKPYFELRPAGALVLRHQPVPRLAPAARARLWLAEHSSLWHFVRRRRAREARWQAVLDSFQPVLPRSSGAEPVALAAALVGEFQQLSSAFGATLVVANTGHRGEQTGLYHRLRPRLQERGVLFTGLESVLGEARRTRPELAWDFPDDHHWNVDAHRVAARTLASFLDRRVLRAAAPR